MLDLRPNCESCDKPLPPDAGDAMICTFECTFCRDCVNGELENVCPNCGGGFTLRPVRPKAALVKYPASTEKKGPGYDRARHAEFLKRYRDVPPQAR